MASDSTTPTPRLLRFSNLTAGFLEDAARRHEALASGRRLGPITGFADLDKGLGGHLAPGLHILNAVPGAGKSAFCWQVAAQCGCPAIFVSCEMAPGELVARAVARETNTYLGKLKSGELAPGRVADLLDGTRERLADVFVLDATAAWPDIEYLAGAIEAARRGREHALLIIDSIHSWAKGLRAEASEYEVLGASINHLGVLARDKGVPILCIAERNRQSMERAGLHASAGHRSFEYSCETMISLDHEKLPGGEDKTRPVVGGDEAVAITVTVSKNRHGGPCRATLYWTGAVQRFDEGAF